MSAVVQEPLPHVHLRRLARAAYIAKAAQMLSVTRLVISLTLLGVQTSSDRRLLVDPIITHSIQLAAVPLVDPKMELDQQLRFVGGWALVSNDEDFGGLSSLAFNGQTFTGLSDKGLLVRFDWGANNRIKAAKIDPLPKGCAADEFKSDRDSESIIVDRETGRSWIGFEWRNAICRSGPDGRRAEALVQPTQMRRWARTSGPEAMVRLSDGRFLVFQERSEQSIVEGEALLYPEDPTLPDTKAARLLIYKPPAPYFYVTDAAQLPDGRLMVLHRNFKPPFQFRAKLSIVDKLPGPATNVFQGKVLASLSEKGLTDNFEGVAVSQANGHTFIWLVSDDNYQWLQHTYLLQFELLNKPG